MQVSERTKRKEADEGREVDLRRVVGFFGSNWKFIALTTLVLTVAIVVLSLLQPQEYYKEMTISVSPNESAALAVLPASVASEGEVLSDDPLSRRLDLPFSGAKDVGDAAEDFLKAEGVGPVRFQVKFNDAAEQIDPYATTKQVDVVLQASSKEPLEDVGPKVVGLLESKFLGLYEPLLSDDVRGSMTEIDRKLAYYGRELGELDRRIDEYPVSSETDPENVKATVELNELAKRRTEVLGIVAQTRFEKEYLRDAEERVPGVASRMVSVQVLSESGVQGTRATPSIAALAIPFAFAVAVSAALARALIRRGKR